MIIGYARISKADDQDTKTQLNILKQAGAEKFYEEKASGGRWDRPELQKMLEQLRRDDVVIVWKLDRLSRSLKDILHIMEKIEEQGAKFKSLTENIETISSSGRMMMQMIGSFAEFERAMIRERTKAGLITARAEGRIGGRRHKLTDAQRKEIQDMVTSGRKTAAQASRIFNVSSATICRVLSNVNI